MLSVGLLWNLQSTSKAAQKRCSLCLSNGKWLCYFSRSHFVVAMKQDYVSDFAWSRLGVEPEELSEIAENRKVFRGLLGMLPRDLPQRKNGYENEWIERNVNLTRCLGMQWEQKAKVGERNRLHALRRRGSLLGSKLQLANLSGYWVIHQQPAVDV